MFHCIYCSLAALLRVSVPVVRKHLGFIVSVQTYTQPFRLSAVSLPSTRKELRSEDTSRSSLEARVGLIGELLLHLTFVIRYSFIIIIISFTFVLLNATQIYCFLYSSVVLSVDNLRFFFKSLVLGIWVAQTSRDIRNLFQVRCQVCTAVCTQSHTKLSRVFRCS